MVTLDWDGKIQIPHSTLNHLGWNLGEPLTYLIFGNRMTLCPAFPSLSISPSAGTLFFRCFGWFSIEWDGHPVSIKCKKLKELLALLTYYHGTPKTKRELAIELWPDSNAVRARDCLYKVLRDLRRLRQNVPLPVCETQDGIYLELTNEQSDLSLFSQWSHTDNPEDWKRAFELYRGGFLDKDGYEWSVMAHSYYELCFLRLIQALSQHCLSIGQISEAKYFQKLVENM